MSQLFEISSRIATPWALAAFAMAAIVFLLLNLKYRKKLPLVAMVGVGGIMLVGLVPTVVQYSSLAIYRVRVTVVDPQGTPVEDAKVWSSTGGEPKRVAGGWQFDIPAAARPDDSNLTVWASMEAAYLRGSQDVRLGGDRNPVVTIQLTHDKTATVRGLVMDRSGRGVAGARVSVAGYEKEALVTEAGGNFVLPAHAAPGQNVLLHVEAKDYLGMTQWHMAGDHPATIVLDRR